PASSFRSCNPPKDNAYPRDFKERLPATKSRGLTPAGRARPRIPRPALAIDDPALAEIVRRHLDAHQIAHDRADAELAHLPGRVSDDPVVVLQHDAEAAIRENFIDLAVEGQKLLFGQRIRPTGD